MGRKKRRIGSADADMAAVSPGGNVAPGKRAVTDGLPPGGGASPDGGSTVPALLARPEAADEAYEVHRPPPVGLAAWFDDVFGAASSSPWSWSADGAAYDKTSKDGDTSSRTKLWFDAGEKTLGASRATEDEDGTTTTKLDVMKG